MGDAMRSPVSGRELAALGPGGSGPDTPDRAPSARDRGINHLGGGGDHDVLARCVGKRRHDLLQLLAQVLVFELAALVEALVRVADGDLALDDAGAGGGEDLAELRLSPDRPEGADA